MNKPSIIFRFEGEPVNVGALLTELGAEANWLKSLPNGVIEKTTRGYVFRFVGLLSTSGQLLVVLPKYLAPRAASDWEQSTTSYATETRLLMRVLQRYKNKSAPKLPTFDGAEASVADYFAGEPSIALSITDDYLEHGYWYRTESEVTTWEGARTDWARTIDKAQALITESGPLYLVRYGYREPTNRISVISQIHRWAVRYCVEKYGVVFPDFEGIWYDQEAAEQLSEIGESPYLLQLLEQEARIAYRDSHLRTLELLRQLILQAMFSTDDESQTLFGTTAFHQVWELACKSAFRDRSSELMALFPIPTWTALTDASYQNFQNTLRPDLVCFDENTILVADAKYYGIVFSNGGRISHNPGMPDITKQLLYEQAVVALLREEGKLDRAINNVFLLPASRPSLQHESVTEWLWGHVESNIPGLDGRKIGVWFLPPSIVFHAFLTGSFLQWK
jgi:hypothetical protein